MNKIDEFINRAYFKVRLLDLKEEDGIYTIKVLVPTIYKRSGKVHFFVQKAEMFVPKNFVGTCTRNRDKDFFVVCRVMFPNKRTFNQNAKFKIIGMRPCTAEDNEINWNDVKAKFYESLERGESLGWD